jgi:predicted S18 family serine protease
MDEKILKNAQYRKGLSIAFFNATNAAIALCAGMDANKKETLDRVIELRDFFLEEHKKYYARVIENVGKSYDAEETLAKLGSAKTVGELREIWLSLSEDERQDDAIIKEVNLLKKKYEEK